MKKVLLPVVAIILFFTGCASASCYADTGIPMIENLYSDVQYEYSEESSETGAVYYYYNLQDFTDIESAQKDYTELLSEHGYDYSHTMSLTTNEGEDLPVKFYGNAGWKETVFVYVNNGYFVVMAQPE